MKKKILILLGVITPLAIVAFICLKTIFTFYTPYQGDEVEFYGVVVSLNGNAVNVASYAHLGPRRDKEGIVFKRSINSDLKATLSQQPVQSKPRGVVMARGPAEDGTNGFPNGWRAEHIAKTSPDLPWAHLLPHISFGESVTILPSTDNGKIMHSKNR